MIPGILKSARKKDGIPNHRFVLLAMGVDVTPTDDGMIIRGGNPVHGGQINSYLDHRIAMAFSIAALAAEGNTKIQDGQCVDVSYPSFFTELHSLSL